MNFKLTEPDLLGIAGDWHADTDWAVKVIHRLGSMGVRRIVQVGDFGIGFGRMLGHAYLDAVNEACRHWGVILYVVRGNHDSDYYEHVLNSHMFYSTNETTGGAHARSHIVFLPRTGRFTLRNRSFFVAGGAVSIDRAFREPGYSWWPEEQLTDAEVYRIETEPVDVLLTHDCSNRTPFDFGLKVDSESEFHRKRIDRVLEKTMPKLHFHGHMHKFYDWQNRIGGDKWTQTYGLDMNTHSKSTGILDLSTLEFRIVI